MLRQWLRRAVLPPVVLFVITVGFYWKFSLSKQYTWMDSPDIVYQVLPWLQFQSTELQQGRLPLWTPHEAIGQPLIGQVQPGALNALLWPFLLLPQSDGHIRQGTVHWFFLTGHFLAALFFSFLLRDRGVSTIASLFGGALYSLAGFPGAVAWPQILYTTIWTPLVLLFYLRGRSSSALANSALSGAFLGMGFLSGHHNVPMFLGVIMAICWGYDCATKGRPLQRLQAAGAFFACALLVAAAVLLPAAEFGRHALRWVGAPGPVGWDDKAPYSVHDAFSVYPESLLGIAMRGMESHYSFFLGWAAVTAAFLAVATLPKDGRVRFFGVVAALGFLYSLGAANLFHGLVYELLPGIDKARNPAMAGAIFHAGASGLAALGLDALRAASPPRDEVWTARALRFLVAFGLLGQLAIVILRTLEVDLTGMQRSLATSAMFALAAAVLLKGWASSNIRPHGAAVLFLCLMLAEVNGPSSYSLRPVSDSFALHRLYEDRDIADFLRGRPDRARVELDNEAIAYNFGDWNGVDQMSAYIPAVIESVVSTMYEPGMRDVLAVSHYVGNEKRDAGQEEAFTGASGLRVYRNPSALPRWRTVHHAVAASDWRQASKMVSDRRIDPALAVSLEGAFAQPETCAEPDAIDSVEYESSYVVLRADMACRGWLILADSWFPGWEARIDGEPTEVHRAYGVIRAVEVPKGSHRVEFVYRPWSLYAGAACLGVGALLPLAFFGWERRATRRYRQKDGASAGA